MPDETATPEAPPADAPENKGDEGKQYTAPKDQAELDRIVNERIRRERAKYADYNDLKTKASKFDELEESKKTETEQLTEKLTAAELRAVNAELAAARVEVAAEKGLTPAQAKRLVGSTKEELVADAEASIEDGTFVVGEQTRRPRPDPDQGRPASPSKEDADAWLREQARR